MKKTSKILILALILNFALSVSGFSKTVYEDTVSSYISKGILRTNIKKLTSSGWLNINYITVNLNEEGVGLKILSETDPKIKSTVLDFAKDDKDVVAAVNADFFTTYTSTASSEGMMIKDGVLVTTPSNDPSYATFTLDNDFVAGFSHFTFDIMVTSKRTNDSSKILFYNKNADPMYLKLYDSSFGEKTPGSMNDGYEVVVEDGIVTEVLSNKEGVAIPKNGYVLHNSLRHSLFLSQNFNVGDEVELSFSVSPDIENIKEAVGGGTILLKDGEIADFTLSDSLAPMTAIGADKTGKKLILFTVDGRQTYSRGMTFSEIASFLKDLGCENAMSFDGGGSTTMVASMDGEEIKNINLQSSFRKVINAIGITAERKKSDFYGMEISLSSDKAFKGEPVEIYIDKAYDEYGNHYTVDFNNVKFSSDKKGKFDKNIFYPEESGEVTLYASYEGVKKGKTITVYNEPQKIKSSVSSFEITDKPQKVSFYLADSEGYSTYLSSENMKFSFEGAKGYFKDDSLILTKLSEGEITATYKDLSITIPVGKEPTAEEEKDIFERTTDADGFNYSVFGINNHGDTLFSNYITTKRNIIANECDFSAFKVIPEDVTSPVIRVSNYGREDTDHSLFLKLDNSKGSIVSTKGEQWDWLLNVFKKGVNQKNVFINMPLDISKHKDKEELKILTDILKKNLKDKNIFIITYADDNTYTVSEGIRYITVSDIPEFSYKDPKGTLEKLKYAKFTIVGEEVYFEFASLI